MTRAVGVDPEILLSNRAAQHLRRQGEGFPKVSRADVADFMIRELTEQAWVRKTVVITS
jgi:hypothetical protein